MVVSKRCKICTIIDDQNVPIAGEYFGKQIPEIILKISGIEIDPRKANDVLICQSCVIQLVHTDVVIEKLRNAVQRLKKTVKDAKPKTPFKKPANLNKSASENGKQQAVKLGENQSKSVKDSAEKSLNTPKKVVRRKSVFPDDKLPDAVDGNNQNGEVLSTAKKVVRRKSVFPDEKLPEAVEGNNVNEETAIPKESLAKKSPIAKRKSMSSTVEADKSISLASGPIDATTVKRFKTVSKSEESPMDLTTDEPNINDTNNGTCIEEIKEKAINCILCGKIFHSKRTLRDHIETAHMGERLKACPHCSSEFRSQQKYESHVFSEKCKGSNHPCQHPNCSKRFKTVHKMELHMQQKHSSQNESECE